MAVDTGTVVEEESFVALLQGPCTLEEGSTGFDSLDICTSQDETS